MYIYLYTHLMPCAIAEKGCQLVALVTRKCFSVYRRIVEGKNVLMTGRAESLVEAVYKISIGRADVVLTPQGMYPSIPWRWAG